MNRIILVISFILVSHLANGQRRNINQDELLFEKALLLQLLVNDDLNLNETINSVESTMAERQFARDIKQELLIKAKSFYIEIVDSFPKSKLALMALDNKGFIELYLGEKSEAINTFQRVLDSKEDDKEMEALSSDIIAEPSTNYKNRAAQTLADIYYRDSNYGKSIEYLNLASKHPYRYICGNGMATDEINMIMSYAKCYLGLKDDKKALEMLLPEIIENGLADNSELVDLTYKTLLKQYERDELRLKFEQAFKNYKTIQVKTKNDNYEEYFIMFLSTKVKIDSWQLVFTNPETRSDEVEKLYRTSKFYYLLNDQ